MIKQKTASNLIVTAMLLMGANFLAKLFGFLREVLLANYYGAGSCTDAYIIANNIPTILFSALGGAIATTYVPMYSKISEQKNEQTANAFTLQLIKVVLVVCFFLTLMGEYWTEQMVYIFAAGFQKEVMHTTVAFTRILFPSIFGIAFMNIFGGYLQLHKKFMAIAIVPIIGNTTIVLSLFLSNYFANIYILVWGTLLGMTVQILYYLPHVIKCGIFQRTKGGITDNRYIVALFKLVIPVFLGESVNEINTIIDRSLVSGLEIGSVSALNYAYKIILLITGVFVASIVTIMYPALSKLASGSNEEHFKQKSTEIVMILFLLVLPIMIVTMMFRREIVRLLFQRGNFNSSASTKTASALAYYLLGIVAIAVRDILSKMFYSRQDAKTPMKNGIFCACMNIILDYSLIKVMGFNGAALATAIVANISCINLLRIAHGKGMLHLGQLQLPILKGICGGVVMTLFYYISRKVIGLIRLEFYWNMILNGIAGTIGVGIYGIIQLLLKNEVVVKTVKGLAVRMK